MSYRYRVTGLLFLLVLVTYLDRLCIAVAGPRMQHDFRLAPSRWRWVLGAFTLAYALFEVPGRMLGDGIGPRRVLTRIVLQSSCTGLFDRSGGSCARPGNSGRHHVTC